MRCSLGRVTAQGGDDSFVSDLDGAVGSSGSPVFDAQGGVIGVFSRVAGWFGW
ncbi:S46 family peptidase [Rubrivivax gelatinosus]|uniref:S46 family peptidase n=1 Tax=Rubrivivax gelatinosus TaxID=28068 RepID=UPI003D3132DD